MKGTLHANNSQEVEELVSEPALKEIRVHPTSSELLVVNEVGVQLLERNFTLPFQIPNSTISDSFLLSQQVEGSTSFNLFLLTTDQSTFQIQVQRTEEF